MLWHQSRHILKWVCSKAEVPSYWQEVYGWAWGHSLPLQDAWSKDIPHNALITPGAFALPCLLSSG